MTDKDSAITEKGREAIIRQVKTLPTKPGVYRMLNSQTDVLYIGKAKNLKKRVNSYTIIHKLSNRLQRMVAETASMEIVTTHTETEALLLEANLIKKLAPKYNILLKDGKSFVYIFIQRDHPWPQIIKHRGPQRRKGEYYGPFASVEAVNKTLVALYKTFLLRSCSDSVFASRTRPCLQYHIKRCSAPCVNWIGKNEYHGAINQARAVLQGKSTHVQKLLAQKMHQASEAQAYEKAKIYRDRIQSLSQIQSQQTINIPGLKDADVLAAHQTDGHTCIQAFFFRNGSNYGTSAFFPTHDRMDELPEVLAAFICQFYEGHPAPKLILTNIELPEQSLIEAALSTNIKIPVRGKKFALVQHAMRNAQDAMSQRLAASATQRKLLKSLAQALDLPTSPRRIEIYDNSHIQGAFAIGAMVVADQEGLLKKAYRKFNIKTVGLSPGDDYGMMREVLTRRFGKTLAKDIDRNTLPDLVIVDGGTGQLNVALDTLADLGIADIPVLAIAKGAARRPGEEILFTAKNPGFKLDPRDPVFYFLQRLRDEAHRFAITTHRAKRSKSLGQSMLDKIPGIGPKRKQALLRHFGSAVSVSKAGFADLKAVDGISKAVAQQVYEHFHPGS